MNAGTQYARRMLYTLSYGSLSWPTVNSKKTKELLNKSKKLVSTMISVYTGHCRLGKPAKRLGLIASDECRFCNDLACGEDMVHLLNECPALDRVRHYNWEGL